jgi:DNA-binding MarR family transcriptional regulator
MTEAPDIYTDFAAWTAHKWQSLIPRADSTAAKVAIRLTEVAEALAESHSRTIRPWHKAGVRNIDDFRTLGLLRHLGDKGMRTSEIAEHLKIDASTMSNRLARLEKNGFTERIEDPTDARSKLLCLKPDKAQTVDDIYEALVLNHERFFKRLDPQRHELLATILGEI